MKLTASVNTILKPIEDSESFLDNNKVAESYERRLNIVLAKNDIFQVSEIRNIPYLHFCNYSHQTINMCEGDVKICTQIKFICFPRFVDF